MIAIAPGLLDAASPTPLYLQLADIIRAQVRAGLVAAGDALPSERALADRIGISRVTVRKALDVLLAEGLLSRRQGSGTYVAPGGSTSGARAVRRTPPAGAAPVSAMARETLESAAAVSRLLAARAEIAAVARRIDLDKARAAVICGRGSSGHAGVHLRYLIETRLGLPVSATAPSVTTVMRRPLKLDGALFVVISQSGASPDLVAATKAARLAGAQTVAIVNAEDSPVEAAAEHVILMQAGPEVSVAATKSVIASLAAGALLTAELAGDAQLLRALERLPARLAAALALDWSPLENLLGPASCAVVASRGFGLGPAREIALKCAETLRLPTLAYSAAELRHGPRAALSERTPVLALRLADETAATVDALTRDLAAAAVPVAVAGGTGGNLQWIGDDHPVTDAIALLAPAYGAIERAARSRGFDPDRPPFLAKVTRTL